MTPRFWPAGLVLAAGAGALAANWLLGDAIRQQRVVRTLVVVVVTLLALLVWLAFFSRLSRRARLLGTGTAVLALALVPALFRVRGVSGDLVPILALRWERPPALPVDATPLEAAPAVEPPAPATPPPSLHPAPDQPTPEVAPATPAPAAARPAFPQFLGPQRDGTLPKLRLARDWSRQPPRRLWRQPIGPAWSGFAVKDGVAVTQEQRGDEELVVAYDARSGRVLWVHTDSARYETVIAGIGPRATPTLVGERVFTLGATGVLNALDLPSGRRLWSRQVVEENNGTLPSWGKSCSPLGLGERVVVSAGGPGGRSLVAYRASDGEPAWAGGGGGSSYSSPFLTELAGRTQVVILNAASVAGHDPESGELLWEQPWPGEQPNVAMPAVLGNDRLLVSAGYGIGAKLFQLGAEDGGIQVRMLWESPRLKSKFANLVVHGGFVYGLDDGVLTCLDPETGERRWKAGRYGHGQLLLAGELLLVQTEQGELVLLEPTPEAHRELSRFALLDGKTWNPPALAGDLLLVRNDREAAAYELPLRASLD